MSAGGHCEYDAGDVFAVPLSDGSECLGQVFSYERMPLNSALCGLTLRTPNFFDPRKRFALSELLSVQLTSDGFLTNGRWRILGNQPLPDVQRAFDIGSVREKGFIGSKVVGSAIIESLLNASRGLEYWDDWHDPAYLDGLLVAPDRKPAIVLYKSDLPKQ